MSVRVAVFNDSPTVRAAIRAALVRFPDLVIVAEAEDGRDAAAIVAGCDADVVVMDVVMPEVDGYQATRAIMAEAPTPILMVSSVLDLSSSEVVFAALTAGAVHMAEPPPPPSSADYARRCAVFAEIVRGVAGARGPCEPAPSPADRTRLELAERPALVGVVASAGGPQAVCELLAGADRSALPPVAIVQHLARGFCESFARWLAGATGQQVRIARGGDPLEAGRVLIAPDDAHMVIDADLCVRLTDDPPVAGFRPSGTVLLESLAAFGPRAAGMILSGMGDDGARGAQAMRRAGGIVIAQDAATSAVYGMPKAVVELGAVDGVMSISGLANWLVRCRT